LERICTNAKRGLAFLDVQVFEANFGFFTECFLSKLVIVQNQPGNVAGALTQYQQASVHFAMVARSGDQD
jgi:hypothetical protein